MAATLLQACHWLFSLGTYSCKLPVTELLAFIFHWQVAPPGLHCSKLVTVDPDWRRLNLLTGSRFENESDRGSIVNWLYTATNEQYTTDHCCCVYPGPKDNKAPPQAPTGSEQRQRKKHIQQDFQDTVQCPMLKFQDTYFHVSVLWGIKMGNKMIIASNNYMGLHCKRGTHMWEISFCPLGKAAATFPGTWWTLQRWHSGLY